MSEQQQQANINDAARELKERIANAVSEAASKMDVTERSWYTNRWMDAMQHGARIGYKLALDDMRREVVTK